MKRTLLLILLIQFSVISTSVNAQPNQSLSNIYKNLGLSENISYTADMIIEPQSGPQINSKFYFKNGSFRTESSYNGMNMITIMKQSGGLYSYNEMLKAWIKTEMADEVSSSKFTKIGKELIDNKTCIKYEAHDPASGLLSTIWINEGIIYKSLSKDSRGKQLATVTYRNITKQKLEDSLFSPPPSATVQDMNALMKGFK